MILQAHKKKEIKDGNIIFPKLQCWNPETLVATFIAELNGNRINCRIKLSSLKSVFPLESDDPMQSISCYMKELEKIATELIAQGRFEEDGSINIGYKDLKQLK